LATRSCSPVPKGVTTQCYTGQSQLSCRTSSWQDPALTALYPRHVPDTAALCPALRHASYCASPPNGWPGIQLACSQPDHAATVRLVAGAIKSQLPAAARNTSVRFRL